MTEIGRTILAAQGYVELGLFADAREEIASLPPEECDRPDVIELQTLCLMGEHEWEQALGFARKLCEAEPREPGGYIHAAYCLHEMGRTEEAIELLTSGPPSLQDKAVYFYNLGCYHARLGQIDSAVRMLRTAFEKDKTLRQSARKDPDLDALRGKLETI